MGLRFFTGSLMLSSLIVNTLTFADNCTSTGTRTAEFWPFSADSVWNLPVANTVKTTTIVSGKFKGSNGGWINVTEWSHPIFVSTSIDSISKIKCGQLKKSTTVSTKCSDTSMTCVEMNVSANATPDPEADGHLHLISADKKFVLETYEAKKISSTYFEATDCVVNDLKDKGIYNDWHGTRAYGGSAIAGLIRKGEVKTGINHALAIAVERASMNRYQTIAGKKIKKGFVWPANTADYGYETTYGTTGNLYLGSYLIIPSTVDVTKLGLSASGVVLAKALQDYGGYIVDASGDNMSLYAEPTAASEITNTMQNELGKIFSKLQLVTNNTVTTPNGGTLNDGRRKCFAPNFER